MMKLSALVALTASVVGFASFGMSPAMAQVKEPELQCKQITDVKPVDGAYKSAGIRRSKVLIGDQRVTDMTVQVMIDPALARTDVGDTAKIMEVWDCGKQTGFKVRATGDDTYDMTEVMLPEGLPVGTAIKSCSKSAGCVSGTFQGFDSWVTLKAGAPASPVTITGKYKD